MVEEHREDLLNLIKQDSWIIPLVGIILGIIFSLLITYIIDYEPSMSFSEKMSPCSFRSRDNHKPVESPLDAPRPWTKVMIAAHGCSKEVQEILDKFPQVNYLKTTGDYVEILKKGVDKGTGLLKLAKAMGIKEQDVYSAGDGYNDVEMLVAAKGGFVPENGSKEALAVAKYVTRSNNEGCIAHAIEMLGEMYE